MIDKERAEEWNLALSILFIFLKERSTGNLEN